MTITIPDALPQLSVGDQPENSGYACVMNAIAYMKGDKTLSDMPSCVWGPFARIAQMVNDMICSHVSCPLCANIANDADDSHQCALVLCSACSHDVWMMGVALIGTAELAGDLSYPQISRAAFDIGFTLVDWKAELWHFRRGAETGMNDAVIASWGLMIAHIEGIRAGHTYPLRAPRPRSHMEHIKEAGGGATVALWELIHTAGPAGRTRHLTNLAICFREKAVTEAMMLGLHPSSEATRLLKAKLPELVGILRRAAGHAAQADIVITAEDVAKVPVGVA